MKYSKREVRELLDKGTHVLKIEHTDEFKVFVLDLYTGIDSNYNMFHYDDWYLGCNKFQLFTNGSEVILFSEIEKEEGIWNSEDMQYMDAVGNWIDIDKHFSIKYRLKTKKSDKELELERLAEELGYNLTKK
jgi:hypothetical protein